MDCNVQVITLNGGPTIKHIHLKMMIMNWISMFTQKKTFKPLTSVLNQNVLKKCACIYNQNLDLKLDQLCPDYRLSSD